MDTQQMFQELDRLYAQGKLDEAEEKMMGWMKEGLDSGNKSLCLMMCNEMEGLYRNTYILILFISSLKGRVHF